MSQHRLSSFVEQQAEFVVDFDNEQNTIPFEITKTDISTGELIPDCTFEILNENNEQVITGTTDENGIAHFQLAIGKYFYREISAPDIYEIDDTPYPFEITENDDIVKAEMTNKKKSGSIKVTKTTTGNLNIEGIKFFATGISDTNKDLKFEATTDENGVAMFDKLVIGKYVITEDGSTVPAAYLVADEQEVTVEYNETAEVAFENIEKTGSIVVHKTTEGQKNVEGITFYLKGTSDSGREINIPATTNKDGIAVFENVPIGTYSIIEDEETVPYGYLVADEKEVKVEYAQTIDATILNNEQTGSITVHKTTEGQKNIEGIKFYLRGTSDTGREIDIPAITDENGIAKFENVPIGTYKVIEDEKTVPYGYLVAAEKEVTVTYAETVDTDILNEEQTGTIQVHKKTADMTNVEGIRFILSGISDTGREIRIEAITDKDGLAKFEGVPIGTYTITEDGSTVPYGYLVADSKQVTVTYAQTVDADMFNEKVPDTPNTGSSDNDIDGRTVLGGVVVILAGAAVILFSRKKKER
ncbi:MAG: collagen binding domain-containing protein [Ruminococcus bicirculans (ex Wegman et al. 2014)]